MSLDSQVTVIESVQESSLYTNNSHLCGLLTNSSSLCAMPNSKAIIRHLSVPCPTARQKLCHIVKQGVSHFSKEIWRQDCPVQQGVNTITLSKKVTSTLSKWFGGKTNIGKTLSSSFTCRAQQRVDTTDAKPTKVTVTLAKNFGGKTNLWKTCQGPWHLV
jgi:hypothetical protein